MIWRPEEGRLTSLINSWKAGEPKLRLALLFIESLPEICWPTGEANYWKQVERYGENTWWAPFNLWRELFHFAGGIFVTGLLLFLPLPISPWWIVVWVFAGVSLNEICDALEEGFHFKNIMDAFFWSLGSSIGVFVFKLLGGQ